MHGEEEHYDFFIINDSTLSTVVYPAWLIIKDFTIIKVSSHNNSGPSYSKILVYTCV